MTLLLEKEGDPKRAALYLDKGNTACYGSQEKMVLLLHWSLGM